MSLKSLMSRLQVPAVVTPVTPAKPEGLQPEPAWIGACTLVTPVTPRFGDAWKNSQIGLLGDAASDPAPEPPADPNAWRELSEAHNAHHFDCHACIAAGRGAQYGLRCGTGAALWINYQTAWNSPRITFKNI